MGVTKQLFQLQELDLEIDSTEQKLQQSNSQLGKDDVLVAAQNKLSSEQKQLDELKRQQHSAEWEIDDLSTKISATEEQLYGGKITNPKELANLQHEIETLKARRDQLETEALEIIDQVELAEKSVAASKNELSQLEAKWKSEQQQLSAEIDQLKNKISDLAQKRQQLANEIDPHAVELYEKLRKQKGQATARVEQGICRACRISLSSSALQRARSGNLVQCSSCGRILYLP
jgi:predicted  nucleic acid-binding Zn-ribbon protein